MEEKSGKSGIETWYNKNYKFILIIPIALLLFSLIYLVSFYQRTGDIIYKDVSLTGGSTVTVYTDKNIDIKEITAVLSNKVESPSIRILTDISTRKQIAFSVETKTNISELKSAMEDYLGYALSEENSSIEVTGTTLSQSFYRELIIAMIIAFLLMSIVIFIIFRVPLPCFYVILCAFTDIIVPIAAIDILKIKISTAGIAAFLMLIGYSVDTDILLTTRILRRHENSLFERLVGALKTGLTMTLTSFFAVFVVYFIVISPVLKQVFIIISIGLIVDIIMTWLGNASMLKWYCDVKKIN